MTRKKKSGKTNRSQQTSSKTTQKIGQKEKSISPQIIKNAIKDAKRPKQIRETKPIRPKFTKDVKVSENWFDNQPIRPHLKTDAIGRQQVQQSQLLFGSLCVFHCIF